MKDRNEEYLVDVFAGSPWEAELVKGLLATSGISSTLKDGELGPWSPYMDKVTVQVNEKDYEAAMEVVRAREKKNDD